MQYTFSTTRKNLFYPHNVWEIQCYCEPLGKAISNLSFSEIASFLAMTIVFNFIGDIGFALYISRIGKKFVPLR
ncbi:hypothetical protein EG346_00700 [Chryseobacterium carnipullorum]|uniref:Uncharacterized protein n=1 Tax=Chryseobacterium carnipullorum TaxID=1124835 RepID=A0A3G6NMH1_CHRCU|nr:hypothetical protein EG346_00700 [Chryseobacterium carnipullorum]AZA66183.1 hypothetical protein EG345_16785 [Chryseobacterium carnipullorum]